MLLYVVLYIKQQQTQQAKRRPGVGGHRACLRRAGVELVVEAGRWPPLRPPLLEKPPIDESSASARASNGSRPRKMGKLARIRAVSCAPALEFGRQAPETGPSRAVIRLSCSLSPAGIRPASRRPPWGSGWPAVRMSCSARKLTAQNALQAIFPGVRGGRAGQGSENAVLGLLRGHFSPFKPSCPSRKASPLLFEDLLTVVQQGQCSTARRAPG